MDDKNRYNPFGQNSGQPAMPNYPVPDYNINPQGFSGYPDYIKTRGEDSKYGAVPSFDSMPYDQFGPAMPYGSSAGYYYDPAVNRVNYTSGNFGQQTPQFPYGQPAYPDPGYITGQFVLPERYQQMDPYQPQQAGGFGAPRFQDQQQYQQQPFQGQAPGFNQQQFPTGEVAQAFPAPRLDQPGTGYQNYNQTPVQPAPSYVPGQTPTQPLNQPAYEQFATPGQTSFTPEPQPSAPSFATGQVQAYPHAETQFAPSGSFGAVNIGTQPTEHNAPITTVLNEAPDIGMPIGSEPEPEPEQSSIFGASFGDAFSSKTDRQNVPSESFVPEADPSAQASYAPPHGGQASFEGTPAFDNSSFASFAGSGATAENAYTPQADQFSGSFPVNSGAPAQTGQFSGSFPANPGAPAQTDQFSGSFPASPGAPAQADQFSGSFPANPGAPVQTDQFSGSFPVNPGAPAQTDSNMGNLFDSVFKDASAASQPGVQSGVSIEENAKPAAQASAASKAPLRDTEIFKIAEELSQAVLVKSHNRAFNDNNLMREGDDKLVEVEGMSSEYHLSESGGTPYRMYDNIHFTLNSGSCCALVSDVPLAAYALARSICESADQDYDDEPVKVARTYGGDDGQIMYIGSDSMLPEEMTCEEFLMYTQTGNKNAASESEREKLSSLLSQLGMRDIQDSDLRDIDYNKRILLIVLAATLNPKIVCVVINDPKLRVDAEEEMLARRIFALIGNRGKCSLIACSSAYLMSAIANRVLVIKKGNKVYDGPYKAYVENYCLGIMSFNAEDPEGTEKLIVDKYPHLNVIHKDNLVYIMKTNGSPNIDLAALIKDVIDFGADYNSIVMEEKTFVMACKEVLGKQ